MKKLTVAEYAISKGITKTAVYKKIKKLNTTEEEKNGRKILYIIVDDEPPKDRETEIKPDLNPNSTNLNQNFNGIKTEIKPDLNPNSTPEIKPISTEEKPETDIIDILNQQLQEKDRQLAEKDKQIERLHELLYRSQQLEAITHKLLGDGETEETEPLQDNNTVEPEPKEKEPEKKGLFDWLFKRKKGV